MNHSEPSLEFSFGPLDLDNSEISSEIKNEIESIANEEFPVHSISKKKKRKHSVRTEAYNINDVIPPRKKQRLNMITNDLQLPQPINTNITNPQQQPYFVPMHHQPPPPYYLPVHHSPYNNPYHQFIPPYNTYQQQIPPMSHHQMKSNQKDVLNQKRAKRRKRITKRNKKSQLSADNILNTDNDIDDALNYDSNNNNNDDVSDQSPFKTTYISVEEELELKNANSTLYSQFNHARQAIFQQYKQKITAIQMGHGLNSEKRKLNIKIAAIDGKVQEKKLFLSYLEMSKPQTNNWLISNSTLALNGFANKTSKKPSSEEAKELASNNNNNTLPSSSAVITTNNNPIIQATGKRVKKPKFSEFNVRVLRDWYETHTNNPYPSSSEKHLMCELTGLTKYQVSRWFCNVRTRKPPPELSDNDEDVINNGNNNNNNHFNNNNNNRLHYPHPHHHHHPPPPLPVPVAPRSYYTHPRHPRHPHHQQLPQYAHQHQHQLGISPLNHLSLGISPLNMNMNGPSITTPTMNHLRYFPTNTITTNNDEEKKNDDANNQDNNNKHLHGIDTGIEEHIKDQSKHNHGSDGIMPQIQSSFYQQQQPPPLIDGNMPK